jgi:probable F420-dependent oxidoreductase
MVWLGGVGPLMTEVAGEVADGFMVHPFCTERSLLEVTLPALARGRARPGAVRTTIQVSLPVMVATGADEAAMAAATDAVRAQIAFYGSTPAYRVVLDVHGWGDLQPVLRDLTRAGDWAAMADVVHDDLLHAVAVVAPPEHVAAEIRRRYGAVLDRVALNAPYAADPAVWPRIAADLQG